MDINIGIPAQERESIAEGLSRVLADSYTLYLKTHNYHWNVTGPLFNTLHLMFEQQYTELATRRRRDRRADPRPGPPGSGELRRLRHGSPRSRRTRASRPPRR